MMTGLGILDGLTIGLVLALVHGLAEWAWRTWW